MLKKSRLLIENELCDHCLGRNFAQLGHGLSNDIRGKSLRVVSAMQGSSKNRKDVTPEPENCYVCSNLFRWLEDFSNLIIEDLQGLEFDSFLVGTRVDPEIQEREEALWAEIDINTAEPIKSELNREIGKRIDKEIDAEVDLERPDVKCILDTRFDFVELEIAPLFIYGRYRKLSRGIPQTRWDCRECGGSGCERCEGTGKMYDTSVEEIIGEPLMEMTGGSDYTFHGMGREDIDALMLGNGRPFVMEISEPIKRTIDLDELVKEVKMSGCVEVLNLCKSEREKVVEIKNKKVDKTYRVKVTFEKEIERAKLKKVIDSFKDTEISQKTPTRVLHRRANKVRKRKIIDMMLEENTSQHAVISLTCQAGTYVKELVHGDQGRTEPSITGRLEVGSEVQELDVIEIHYR